MASTIPTASGSGATGKSRSRRLGALLDLSRGELPRGMMKASSRQGAHSSLPTPTANAQARGQASSRLPQKRPVPKPALSVGVAGPAGLPSAQAHQHWPASSRSGPAAHDPTSSLGATIEPAKPRNVLRRKQSAMLREPSNPYERTRYRSDSGRTGSSSSIPKPQTPLDSIIPDQVLTESPVEIRSRHSAETHRAMAQPRVYPELDRYRNIPLPALNDGLGREPLYRLATEDLPPPTPQFSGASSHSQLSSFSASPSTRFSDSPGTGPYSRDTTPTSMCSQSPGLVAPMRLPAARVRQASPAETRPPVTRRRAGSISKEEGSFSTDPQGLAAVREALTSSSSNSTVRAEEKTKGKSGRGRTAPPPSPPPRKSSQKFKKGRNADETQTISNQPQIPAQSILRSPSPAKQTRSTHTRAPSSISSPQPRPTPPSRPSRDGTPDLYSQYGDPVPVIHSNISSASLTERRHSGLLQPSLLPSIIPRTSQDRTGASRPSLSREATPAPRPGVPEPSHASRADSAKGSIPPSPNVPGFMARFPLFSRRTKSGSEATSVGKKKEKVSRKGPAAGTGHEGYGRIGAVKRRSSTTSNIQRGIAGPTSSSESLPSTLSDAFLLERINPVIIAGGEVVENQNIGSEMSRIESNQSTRWARPGLGSRNPSAASIPSNRQTLWPSPLTEPSVDSRRPSNSSGAGAAAPKPSLANRRSMRGLQIQAGAEFKLHMPIGTRAPSAASMATTIYTDDSFPDTQSPHEPEPPVVSAPATKLTKRARSPSKWNFFGKRQAPPSPPKPAEEMPATVQPAQNKATAFYTLMDSPEQTRRFDTAKAPADETGALSDVERRPSYDRKPSSSVGVSTIPLVPQQGASHIRPKPSDTVPRMWQLEPRQQKRLVSQEVSRSAPGRPSRLPQVGRIPKVVTSRPEQTSPKSFSRPFNRISVQLPPAPPVSVDQDSIAKGPSPPESLASRTACAASPERTASPIQPGEDQPLTNDPYGFEQPREEFLAFSPRKDSECTASSESSYLAHTAQVPEPSAPLGEDEVWDEFNDLLEDAPPSPTSSCGVPFPLETYHSKLTRKVSKPLESPTVTAELVQDARASVATAKTTTTSSHHSTDMTARINAAFRFNTDPPTTPFPVSDPVSGYDRSDEKKDVEGEPEVEQQESKADVHTSSSSVEVEKTDKAESKRSSNNSKRSSESSRLSEETPLSQVNLRVGSMTVSKWLTFGHVLFSPVREELVNDGGSLKRQSILVIDGLGNDDWSYYAAETYPAANFFNLSPRPPVPKTHQAKASFPRSPPNHHQIQFTSYAEKFPFGPESFTAIVFRFPSAAPEADYHNIISEAERVLKPGGYIELSVLDVDLNNMGNRARRAVRRLKERVNEQNRDFSLGSTADLILRLLGKKGFSDIKTCRVGVPAASAVGTTRRKDGKKDERSLREMMDDDTELGDENITKMVSKVGRWWYNRCYEVQTGMTKSIWNDRALLTECEEWGTSLKLMVCHARVPEAKGRVASI
ncbi:hypothetical protein F5Y17DRAFT_215848 [Xylariaceae sp. FL0594]|nr:hypothetical protein F5Y17DRAFT_215848 [Xylariaceae sp. FL0594]